MGVWVHRLSDIDGDYAVCANCGPIRLSMKKRAEGVYQPRCPIGVKKQAKGPQEVPDKLPREPLYRSRGHRLSPAEAQAFREGKSCEVCGATKRLHIDHEHSSGRIRGVLCHFCNLGIGHFKDSPELLRSAARYLA